MSERPRPVALFIRSFEGGGAERVAVTLANELRRRNFPVDLVVQYERGSFRRDVDPRIRIIGLNRRVRFGLLALIGYLRQRRPRVLLAFVTEPNVLAVLAWRLIRMDGVVAVSERSSVVGARRGRRLAMKLIYPRANRVIAVSESLKSELSNLGVAESKLVSIPNPLHPDIWSEAYQDRNPARGSLPLVIGVGRLSPEKDFPTLIRAFEILCRSRPARLTILGEGPDRERLEKLILDLDLVGTASLPGFVTPPWSIMGSASVLVLSSLWEGWPNVLAEALALGIPVVSTDCPTGPNEILANGAFGRLVPVGDSNEMAEAISSTLEHPPDPRTLQLHAQQWSTKRIVDRYLEALERTSNPE